MGFRMSFKKTAPNKETMFRKCIISSCPYRATFSSIYCKKHLKEYKKKSKKIKDKKPRSDIFLDVNTYKPPPRPPPRSLEDLKNLESKIHKLNE